MSLSSAFICLLMTVQNKSHLSGSVVSNNTFWCSKITAILLNNIFYPYLKSNCRTN